MYIEDDNIIYLCNTKLDENYDNQIVFSSIDEQFRYFSTEPRLQHIVEGVTFVREPNSEEPINYIDVELPIDSVSSVNYIMYKNSNEPNYKFAFVRTIRYYNDEIVRMNLVDDVIQNNIFDILFSKSFIERESVNIAELNTLSDDVAHGQLIAKKTDVINMTGAYFVFCSSPPIADDVSSVRPFSLKIGNYSTPCFVMYWSRTDGEKMSKVMQGIANKGWGDRILSCVYIPLVNGDSVRYVSDTIDGVGEIHIVEELPETMLKESFTFNYDIEEYGKANTYPYSKIVIRDQPSGMSVELAPEKFKTIGKAEFEIRGTIGESPIYKIIPKNYEGQTLAFNHALVVKCGTGLQVANNLYSKYLMQNSEMNNFNRNLGVVGGIVSVATGNPIGGIISAYGAISSVTLKENQASTLGNTVTSYSDDAIFRLNFPNAWDITLYGMDDFHKNMATSFWEKFGYPQRKLYTPNLMPSGDKKYIKILEPVIYGNIETSHKAEITKILQKGITLWKNDIK